MIELTHAGEKQTSAECSVVIFGQWRILRGKMDVSSSLELGEAHRKQSYRLGQSAGGIGHWVKRSNVRGCRGVGGRER